MFQVISAVAKPVLTWTLSGIAIGGCVAGFVGGIALGARAAGYVLNRVTVAIS